MNYSECVRNYWAGNLSSSGSFAQGTVMAECGFSPPVVAFIIGMIIGLLVVGFAFRKKEDVKP